MAQKKNRRGKSESFGTKSFEINLMPAFHLHLGQKQTANRQLAVIEIQCKSMVICHTGVENAPHTHTETQIQRQRPRLEAPSQVLWVLRLPTIQNERQPQRETAATVHVIDIL